MTETTPGPWKYEVNRTCDGYEKHIIRSEAKLNPYEGDWVCACGGMKEGDGNLIAAAPDMLEMLEEIALQFRRGQDIHVWYPEIIEVIAKAKGEQG